MSYEQKWITKRCGQDLGSRFINKTFEQQFKSFEQNWDQKLWMKVLKKSCEQDCNTKVMKKNCGQKIWKSRTYQATLGFQVKVLILKLNYIANVG